MLWFVLLGCGSVVVVIVEVILVEVWLLVLCRLCLKLFMCLLV